LFVIGIGMLFYALGLILEAYATGLGAPRVQGAAFLLGLLAALLLGPRLVSQYGMLGASLSFACGTLAALLLVAAWTWRYLRSGAV
jgi:hypothetical protein